MDLDMATGHADGHLSMRVSFRMRSCYLAVLVKNSADAISRMKKHEIGWHMLASCFRANSVFPLTVSWQPTSLMDSGRVVSVPDPVTQHCHSTSGISWPGVMLHSSCSGHDRHFPNASFSTAFFQNTLKWREQTGLLIFAVVLAEGSTSAPPLV